MSTFKNKNSLRTVEAQTTQKLKNNETWPKFTGSYKKKARTLVLESRSLIYFTQYECDFLIRPNSQIAANPLLSLILVSFPLITKCM